MIQDALKTEPLITDQLKEELDEKLKKSSYEFF